MRLPRDSHVELVQMLGGHFTVDSEWQGLVRIDGQDAEALGLPAPEPAPEAAAAGVTVSEGPLTRDQVLEVLRNLYDPEIPINVVDLGLIYACELSSVSGGTRVAIQMSMTAPGCGMGDVLREDVKQRLTGLPGVREAKVEIVWDPPWNTDRMSEAAKLELGWL